jgi:uncharacterized protein YrrD
MLKKMELKEGVGVFTPDGQQVGKINRFVLDPATNEVTHLVVQKGWFLADDKVVSLQMISSATEEKVVLAKNIDLNKLPPFEEKHFIRTVDEDIPQTDDPAYKSSAGYYWYPPEGYIGYPAYGPEYYAWPPVETRRNIPENTVPLREGANVISSDNKHVGDIERLFIEPDSNRTTHFLITQGLLLKERKLIPAHWVKTVGEDEVHLTVSSQLLERLPAYTP